MIALCYYSDIMANENEEKGKAVIVRLPEKTLKKVDAKAKAERRSRNGYITKTLERTENLSEFALATLEEMNRQKLPDAFKEGCAWAVRDLLFRLDPDTQYRLSKRLKDKPELEKWWV